MNDRQLVQQVRCVLEQALPDAPETVKRWFCRLCALVYMKYNGLLADVYCLPRNSMALFADCPDSLPDSLQPAIKLLETIPAEAWHTHPELPGWLYQYYNTPEREDIFAARRGSVKIPKERIPAATQLFTPDWIVQYMTQNALGTVYRPLSGWKYYLPPKKPLPVCQKSLRSLRILDPCMGTGHILVYVFDALMELYQAEGYAPALAAEMILRENLFGLDIDSEAAALAQFILRMKAAQYIPDIHQHIPMHLEHFAGLDSMSDTPKAFAHADMFGSLLQPPVCGSGRIRRLSELLNHQYDAVITNPPYMGNSSMDRLLSAFVKTNYPAGKADLFAAFMERCARLTAPEGCFSMVTQHSWMFLSTYRALRRYMRRYSLQSMVHLGAKAFSQLDVGTIVQTTAFTALGREVSGLPATYLRLTEQEDKDCAFFDPTLRYTCTTERFEEIPGEPLCYWISDRMLKVLHAPKLSAFCRVCQGMTTSDNKRFLRRWYEVPPGSIAYGCRNAAEAMMTGKVWFPYNKGGRLRRWYGNHNWVVNYRNNGEELRNFHAELNKTSSGGRLKNTDMYFRPAVTWPFITESTKFGVRLQPEGFLFDVSGSCLFPEERDRLYLMGLLSSCVVLELLKVYNPTLNFQVENLSSLPILFDETQRPEVEHLVSENIRLAREDWDSMETSWDFVVHPLVQTGAVYLREAFQLYQTACRGRIAAVQRNEQRLNQIFAEIYGLTEELDCAPPESTMSEPNVSAMAEQLISFAVGCLFGRYSLPGVTPLAENYLELKKMPLYLTAFLKAVYGQEYLTKNIVFLEEALGDTLVHYCMVRFYPSHCRQYHKRPLYWLASSGRQHAVYGLCYVHRMGNSPVAALTALTEKMPISPELTAYRKRLAALQGVRLSPDAGIQENHAAFDTVFAKIR